MNEQEEKEMQEMQHNIIQNFHKTLMCKQDIGIGINKEILDLIRIRLVTLVTTVIHTINIVITVGTITVIIMEGIMVGTITEGMILEVIMVDTISEGIIDDITADV